LHKRIKEVVLDSAVNITKRALLRAVLVLLFFQVGFKLIGQVSTEEQENKHSSEQRSLRNVDRTVKDLQAQIDRRDKISCSSRWVSS
jgi:hypothetical protein